MLKKIWIVLQYIVLVILLMSFATAIYLGNLQRIFGGIIFITFWITMMLENKSPNKNKIVSTLFYTTGAIILVVNIAAVLFGFTS
ncbi:hypothetical protein EAI30_12355 [Romboutsia ilealis]|uniref:Group-specific protein n=1 Tax=Romboutsia faecis TaxID=2764597 RepID=A0ABR7JSP5_9FIRM|nr:hypothetical protein [Romboutsia faecis]MBC5997641.1 hypothetical protein [Romboutsia faecis]MRN25410.1 hypothetical protein [Romboutsia ilealis]